MDNEEILEPLKCYEVLGNKFHENNTNFFDELVKKSNINVEENQKTVKEYKEQVNLANYWEKKETSVRTIKGLLIFLCVVSFIVSFVFFYLGFQSLEAIQFVVAALTLCLAIGLIVLIATKIKNLIKIREAKKLKHKEEAAKLLKLAYDQLEPLNELYDWDIPSKIVSQTTDLIKLDKTFDPEKFQYLHEKYNLHEILNENISVCYVQSGSIVGNPFVIINTYNQNFANKTYTGSLVIEWETYSTDSDGHVQTHHHTQTLHASIVRPVPNYYHNTYLVYACDAALNLSFSREPFTDIVGKNEKQIEKIVEKGAKKFVKMEKDATNKGRSFTKMANDEFEVLFNSFDRDNEVEYRFLFTPLAQRNLIDLIKSKVPYGDDFSFTKDHGLNFIRSSHSQSISYLFNPSWFTNYDIDDAKRKFIQHNDILFQGLYFDLAPLISIPAYQQIKPKEYIYNEKYVSNVTRFEHESLANSFNVSFFKPEDACTNVILKSKFIMQSGNSDVLDIEAHSFTGIDRVEFVDVLGGDGFIHAVPVPWIEYIPVDKTTRMEIKNTNKSRLEFKEVQNSSDFSEFMSQQSLCNGTIFERGLAATLLRDDASNDIYSQFDKFFK